MSMETERVDRDLAQKGDFRHTKKGIVPNTHEWGAEGAENFKLSIFTEKNLVFTRRDKVFSNISKILIDLPFLNKNVYLINYQNF